MDLWIKTGNLYCDSVSSFHDGLAYFSVDGKYGFLNQQGDVVIEAVYDDVSYFQDGIAQVRRNNLTGMIDSRGEEIVPVEYEYIWRGEGILDCVRENGTRDYYTFAGEKSTEEEYIRGKHAARKGWEYSLDGKGLQVLKSSLSIILRRSWSYTGS